MNKIIIYLFIGFFIILNSNISFSQSCRITTGLDISNMAINDQQIFSDNLKINAGIITDFPIFKEYFSLETGIILSTKGYKTRHKETHGFYNVYINRTNRMDLYYLNTPLALKYSYINNNIKIFGSAGPYVGIGLFKKNKLKVEDYYLSETHTNWLNWESDVEYNLKRFDYGLSAGLGFEATPLVFSFYYNLGLADISATPDYKINNRNLAFSVGYIINNASSTQNEELYISLNPKVGISNLFILGSTLNFRNNNLMASADYYYLLDLNLFGGRHSDSFSMLGFSVGKRFIINRFLIDSQIGAGIIWHKYYIYEQFTDRIPQTELSTITESTIGLNMKTGIKYFPNNKFAIGVDALVSVNKLENLYALPLFSIEYGFMR